MRADIGTEVTLDTVVRIPYRNVYCDTALLVCGRTGRCGTVNVILERGYRKVVSFLGVYCSLYGIYELNNVFSSLCGVNHVKTFVLTVLPAFRNLDLVKSLGACVDGSPVLHNDVLALTAVGCLCSSLH